MVKRHEAGKWDAAMCAAPRALAHYGVLDDADFTCYPGIQDVYKRQVQRIKYHASPTSKEIPIEGLRIISKLHQLLG